MTYIYHLKNIGKIHTMKQYKLDASEFTLFVSIPSPPIVYEIRIDSNLNVNTAQVYRVQSDTELNFISDDMITANEYYVAVLMYDYFKHTQIVRIFYRNETNYCQGHSDISMKGFISKISSISFLSYSLNKSIFIRNSQKWMTFRLDEPYLIIDSKNYPDQFNSFKEKTYNLTCAIRDAEIIHGKCTQTFKLIFVADSDMRPYYIAHQTNFSDLHIYANPSYKFEVSSHY